MEGPYARFKRYRENHPSPWTPETAFEARRKVTKETRQGKRTRGTHRCPGCGTTLNNLNSSVREMAGVFRWHCNICGKVWTELA
jgi:ribosomal protein L37AE/L43A